jgi:hypothetical protein
VRELVATQRDLALARAGEGEGRHGADARVADLSSRVETMAAASVGLPRAPRASAARFRVSMAAVPS